MKWSNQEPRDIDELLGISILSIVFITHYAKSSQFYNNAYKK